MKTRELKELFADVVSCRTCDHATSKKLLRDNLDNIPQPGYVGENYGATRVLLVGQNPGIAPEHMVERDRKYIKSLRRLSEERTEESYKSFHINVLDFVPEWPVNRNYFPLEECGLSLDDIAYCNVVRCRTIENSAPGKKVIDNCIDRHFLPFIEAVTPKVVVFIGKWGYDRAAPLLPDDVKCSFMNRQRSLSNADRAKNRAEVVALVKQVIG